MNRRTKTLAAAPSLLAIALHFVTFFRAEGGPSAFTCGLLIWSWLPYAICLIAIFAFRSGLPAFIAGTLALAIDLTIFDSVFLRPQHSTAALGLLYAPLANLFVVAVVLLAGWGSARRLRRNSAN